MRIGRDEVPPRLDLVAHQNVEVLVGEQIVVELDLPEHTIGGVHRRLPELGRVHLSEPLVALHPDLGRVGGPVHVLAQFLLGVAVLDLLALLHPIAVYWDFNSMLRLR